MAKRDPNFWMLTFSDMNTLMLTFFVMLISMSSFDTQTFRDYAGSIKESLVSISGGAGVFKRQGGGIIISRKEALIKAKKGISGQVLSELTKHLDVVVADEGWTIKIPGRIIFDRNSYEVKPEALRYLKKIALFVWKTRGEVRIVGYTDTNEKDKWWLSIKRASSVLNILLKEKNIDPARMTIMGYADTRIPGRRVEIFVEKRS
jgi:chemotaxis protein MotB